MAQLVLENISPVVVRELEQRARRSGRTIEAEAVRLLEAKVITTAEEAEDAELESVPNEPGEEAPEARILADRQEALAESYPNEYVVILGDRLLAHTPDKEEAYAHDDGAFEQGGGVEPIMIPPGALRRIAPPILRGRALSRVVGAGRK